MCVLIIFIDHDIFHTYVFFLFMTIILPEHSAEYQAFIEAIITDTYDYLCCSRC